MGNIGFATVGATAESTDGSFRPAVGKKLAGWGVVGYAKVECELERHEHGISRIIQLERRCSRVKLMLDINWQCQDMRDRRLEMDNLHVMAPVKNSGGLTAVQGK